MADRASEVEAAVDWVAARPGIDPARVGLPQRPPRLRQPPLNQVVLPAREGFRRFYERAAKAGRAVIFTAT